MSKGPKTAALKDVGPQAHFRTLTPPKYQAAKTVTLEERLEDFIEWLRKKGIILSGKASIEDIVINTIYSSADISKLIEEYVNT